MADEGFHEIQLSGKQLVFLFMAATVVGVVIFLSGVMVGRGVRVQRGGEAAAAPVDEAVDPTASAEPSTAAPVAAPPTTESGSAATRENLSYPDRLAADAPPPETLKEPAPVDRRAEPSPPPPAPAAVPAAAPAAAAPGATPPAPAATQGREPARSGYVVQVAALRVRADADRIAQRLTAKGYPAFVTTPGDGAPSVFRVRVRTYKDRREAEAVALRLEKEEQFKPWITR